MSKRARWLVFASTLLGGLLLGFLGSVLIPRLGLVALYERVGGWALLGQVAVALLLIAIPNGERFSLRHHPRHGYGADALPCARCP